MERALASQLAVSLRRKLAHEVDPDAVVMHPRGRPQSAQRAPFGVAAHPPVGDSSDGEQSRQVGVRQFRESRLQRDEGSPLARTLEPGPRVRSGVLLATACLFGLLGSTLVFGRPKSSTCCASGEHGALRATEFVLVDDGDVPIARLGASARGVGVEFLDRESSKTRLWLGLGSSGPHSAPQLIMFGAAGDPMIAMDMEVTSVGEVSTLSFGRPGSHFAVLTGGHNVDGQLVLRSSVPIEPLGPDGHRVFPAALITHSGVNVDVTSREHPSIRSDGK